MTKLKKIMKAQNAILNALFAEVDTLSAAKTFTRSDRIKESIDKIEKIAEQLDANRTPLHGTLTTAARLVDRAEARPAPVATNRENTANIENQKAILKSCDELKVCVSKQQEDIDTLKSNQPRPTYAGLAGTQNASQQSTARGSISEKTQKIFPQPPWTKVERPKPKPKAKTKGNTGEKNPDDHYPTQ